MERRKCKRIRAFATQRRRIIITVQSDRSHGCHQLLELFRGLCGVSKEEVERRPAKLTKGC